MKTETETQPYIFRYVCFEDAPLLLKWRNDPETRKQSHTTHEISLQEHQAWLRKRLSHPTGQMMLILEKERERGTTIRPGIPVGTIRADWLNPETVEISYTVAPEFRGQQIGSEMLGRFLRLFLTVTQGLSLKRLTAEVKQGNLASQRILEKHLFRLEKTENGTLYYGRGI